MEILTNSCLTNVHITVGLPGSGKTHFVKQQRHGYIIDCDKNQHENRKQNNKIRNLLLIEYINDKLHQYYGRLDTVYIDGGLFLSNEIIISVLNLFSQCENQKRQFYIHIWNDDRESCLWNDKYRREIDSSITIKHTKVNIDISEIKSLFKNVEIIYHIVEKVPEYIIFARKFFGVNETIFKSPICYIKYYNNLPLEFDKFDEIIDIICPNITVMMYKKMRRICSETILNDNSDYYGNTDYSINHQCDIEKLYNFLIENKLFNKGDL
jgi:hypothetical protein